MRNQSLIILYIFIGIFYTLAFTGCEPLPPAEWPDAPRGVSAYRDYSDPTTITVRWNSVDGADSYNVYYSNSTDTDNFIFEGSTQKTSYTGYDFYEDASWYFKVAAVNSLGEEGDLSSWTQVSPVGTQPPVVTNPFLGTWKGWDGFDNWIEMTFTETTWNMTWPEDDWDDYKGTYTRIGNKATLKKDGEDYGSAEIKDGLLWVDEGDYGYYSLSRDGNHSIQPNIINRSVSGKRPGL